MVDPATARVSVVSDPLPQIVGGVPLRLRTIQVNLNRQEFALNPTNCDPFAVETSIGGDEGAEAHPSAGFQVANCSDLPFGPKLGLKFAGSSKRRGHPALQAVLRSAPGDANIEKTVVTLPKAEIVDNAHIGTVCTRVQFGEGKCPAGSLMGTALVETPLLAKPLSGNVYLRSSNHELPDLVIDLHGQFDIELDGRLDSPKGMGLRTTFAAVPDAPFTKFVLKLNGGKKGLLVSSESLCTAAQKAAVQMVGQNGATTNGKVKVQTSCGSNARHKRHRAQHKRPTGHRRAVR
jgi:hypothetical protein